MDSLVQEIVAPEYEDKKRSFFTYYSENERRLVESADAFGNLIRLLLSSSGPEGAKVLSRVKNKHECITKFDLKYRQDVEKSKVNYEIIDFISDVVGVRVICLYESQISEVVARIRGEFNVVKEEDKTVDLYEKLRFGYKGVHLDLSLNDIRRSLPEYEKFSDIVFELQIRSIVQDAWSEVDHKLKYKKQIPDPLKRRIIRLAALFELADQEFEEIRKTTDNFESQLIEKVNKENPDDDDNDDSLSRDALDAFSFLEFASRRYKNYNFESYKVDGFVDDIKRINPHLRLSDFKRIFDKNFDIAHKYRTELREKDVNINPYTHMRHIFIAEDHEFYSDLLYPKQKERFLLWLEKQETGSS